MGVMDCVQLCAQSYVGNYSYFKTQYLQYNIVTGVCRNHNGGITCYSCAVYDHMLCFLSRTLCLSLRRKTSVRRSREEKKASARSQPYLLSVLRNKMKNHSVHLSFHWPRPAEKSTRLTAELYVY